MFRCSGHGADKTMWTVEARGSCQRPTLPPLPLPSPSSSLFFSTKFLVKETRGEGVRAAVHEREGKDGSKARDGLKDLLCTQ